MPWKPAKPDTVIDWYLHEPCGEVDPMPEHENVLTDWAKLTPSPPRDRDCQPAR